MTIIPYQLLSRNISKICFTDVAQHMIFTDRARETDGKERHAVSYGAHLRHQLTACIFFTPVSSRLKLSWNNADFKNASQEASYDYLMGFVLHILILLDQT